MHWLNDNNHFIGRKEGNLLSFPEERTSIFYLSLFESGVPIRLTQSVK